MIGWLVTLKVMYDALYVFYITQWNWNLWAWYE